MAEAFKPIDAAAVNVLARVAAHAPTLPRRYPSIAKAVANHLARREIERQLQAQGIRLTTYRYAKVVALARVYFVEHEEELFVLAMERVRKSPWHSMMAQREERERQREERKREREWQITRNRPLKSLDFLCNQKAISRSADDYLRTNAQ